jgi:hypothetical protein
MSDKSLIASEKMVAEFNLPIFGTFTITVTTFNKLISFIHISIITKARVRDTCTYLPYLNHVSKDLILLFPVI